MCFLQPVDRLILTGRLDKKTCKCFLISTISALISPGVGGGRWQQVDNDESGHATNQSMPACFLPTPQRNQRGKKIHTTMLLLLALNDRKIVSRAAKHIITDWFEI